MEKEQMKGLVEQILSETYNIDVDGYTKDELLDIAKKILFIAESPDYEKGYNILSDFWDSIADELKEDTNKRLLKCGL